MHRRYAPWILLLCLNGAAWFFFARENPRARGSEPRPKRPEMAEPQPVITNVVIQTNEFEWRQLESEDYRTYIERLRGIGCPEETIRDIIIADLEKLMSWRVREIEGTSEPPQYWKPSRKHLTSVVEALEKSAQKQEVDFEKREIVRELLGIDLASQRALSSGEADFYDQRLSFLDAEKRTRVRILMEKANQEEMLLREKSWLENDRLTLEERVALREIQNRKEAGIAALLSPEEQEQFNLWFSPAAYRVREAFLALEPNEADYLALYRIQREFDERWGSVEPAALNHAEKAQYELEEREMEFKIQQHLGPERFERYQHAHDPDFRELQSTAVQFGLPPEATSTVYDYRSALQQERARVLDNSSLASAQKQAILQALSEETEHAVVEALGPRAYKYYLRQGAGQWIWTDIE